MKFEEVYGCPCRGALGQAEAPETLGVSAGRAPVDEVMRVIELFDTRYRDFTAKHFHEKLVADHGCTRNYNWVRLTLQAHGRKRERRAMPGIMLGSSHEWVSSRQWDPIVTPRARYTRLLRCRGGYDIEFPGAPRVNPGARAVLLALGRPHQPLLAHAGSGRQGGQGQSDPGWERPDPVQHLVDRGLLARGEGPPSTHVWDLAEAPPAS
ncbi:MAG: hypothetical protein OXD42_12295 [Rhodospirillaceae bacterium]|nr:hypothetical protein [Rhodospirillaceae bacterium]